MDRLSTVRPGTVVVTFAPDRAPQLRQPGELLIPSWAPFLGGVDVLVVNTRPVTVDVTVQHLLTLDGEDLREVSLAVSVRLNESAIVEVVAAHGADAGAQLLLDVQTTTESSIRAAVGMNRAQDLGGQALARVLQDRWLPRSFAHGALNVESFNVNDVRWKSSTERRTSRDEDQSSPAEAAPKLGTLGRDRRSPTRRSATYALQYVYVPALISLGVSSLFFTVYWVPEFLSFPGMRFVLQQLAPLASKELTSQSQPLVPSQLGQLGLTAAFLLIVALLMPAMARSRWWVARLALWPLTYIAAVGAVVTAIGIAVREQVGGELVGLLLLIAWVASAVVTTWRTLWVDVDDLPRRPAHVLWLLALFALVNPTPVALGRRLFTPQLRTAAVSVQDDELTLRWVALLTPTTALVYLCGLLLGVTYWAGYLLCPPRRVRKVAFPAAALVLALAALVVIGPRAAESGKHRAAVISTESPINDLGYTCGAWTQYPAGLGVETLVATGRNCKKLTTFSGYRETASRVLVESVNPVRAETLDGQRIQGKLVGAQFGEVVVLAATDRVDKMANILLGVRMSDAAELWRFRCPQADTLGSSTTLRFANSTAGDDSTAGRLTLRGEPAKVVVQCLGTVPGAAAGSVQLDPLTGRRR